MAVESSIDQPARLRRQLGLPLLVLYGTGITIGAGIYVLIGAVAGHAGVYAPWSFLLAAAAMGLPWPPISSYRRAIRSVRARLLMSERPSNRGYSRQ